jgi:peptidoglycan L-alanyl-D-glutamate endopeptidase CwlK|tara:strand:+ start:2776 stop:3162 length:387 start_codon:yes stop_codon:yes gene_type:complete
MFKLGANSLKNREGIDERLIEITDLAISLSNVDFGIPSTGGLRTLDDQVKLFTEGKSKCDGRATKSYHQTGKAVDVYAYVDGKASWDKLDLALVAAAMLQASAELGYELKWGGLWKSWQDYPHFELEV